MESDPQPGFGLGTSEVRRRHILPKALLVGLVSGLLASAFRLSLGHAEAGRLALMAQLPWFTGLPAALVIGAGGGAVGLWLVRRFAPEAAGSGIPHLKSVLLGAPLSGWRRLLPVKFASGVIGIGGGLALGREGPTVQMGGAVGEMVSEWFRVKPGEGERRALLSAGRAPGSRRHSTRRWPESCSCWRNCRATSRRWFLSRPSPLSVTADVVGAPAGG